MNAYEEYMKQIVVPMRRELTSEGFTELQTAEEVENFMNDQQGIALVVVNSVCGCAAGLARPAVTQALHELDKQPNQLVTVFAGQDKEATEMMRSYFGDVLPSSPSIGILKNKELAYFIPREQIEGFAMEDVKNHVKDVLSQLV